MTTLTPEQKQAVSGWVAAGDNLSAIQKKLADQFKLSITYMDVRFLVDDLGLNLKDAAPKVDTNLKKTPEHPAPTPPGEKKGFLDKAKEKLGLGREPEAEAELEPEFADEEPAGGRVSITVDKLTLTPGAVASGAVTFSDGVTAKWMIDNYGRPGLSDVSRKDYRPSPADAQAFMQELSAALQQRGF